MQFYLAQKSPLYFTYLPKTSAGCSTQACSAHQMAWAGRSLADKHHQVSATNQQMARPRKLLLAILTLVGLTLPLTYYQFSSTQSTRLQGSAGQPLASPIVSSELNNGTNDDISQKIATQKVLKLAVVDTALIATDKVEGSIDPHFVQSYGRALAQHFANTLGATLEVARYSSQAQAQNAIVTGKADMLMTSPTTSPTTSQSGIIKAGYSPNENLATPTNLATVNVACQANNNAQSTLIWQMKHSSDKFANRVQAFLCDNKSQHDNLWQFYTQNTLLDTFNQEHFEDTIANTLPRLKPIFQQNAQTYHHDWKMLTAVAYQESHLQANAVSPTGVRGIMMLTNDTAKAMGVSNRTNPTQSIKGGAKYLEILQSQFSDVPESDRLWFTLAAYNMGPMSVIAIQDKLRQSGKNANSWAEVYHYMMVNKKYTPRYIQCMEYVSNIHGYLTLLSLDSQSATDPSVPNQAINQLT